MASPLTSTPTTVVSLSDEILEKILLCAAEIRVKDVFSARMTYKMTNQVANEPRFLKAVLLFDFDNQMPVSLTIGLSKFRKACPDAENPDALFLRGISAYLFEYSPEIDVAYITEAAKKGCSYARYAYEILRKHLYPPKLGLIKDSCPELTRKSARSIRLKVTALQSDFLTTGPLPYYVGSG